MFNPQSTYRIQFHKEFTFKDFDQIIPYLHQLGVNTIYASPILEAVPGSMHGYDTVNPERINPEIGTLQELKALAKKLKKLGIRWIQDIVPNHMAFHPSNVWLMDVLKKGAKSKYAEFFDINWTGDKESPLMVPFLGSTLEQAIENEELELVTEDGQFYLKYFETKWPVNDRVKSVDTPLQEVLSSQYYRLCHWEETNERINFRRFFTVNALICLNMQYPQTFTAYHKLIITLLKQGVFQGLRVDHIDGLYDPEGYLEQLRTATGTDTYIIIEKILEDGEEIPVPWPIEGNTGYDFLAQANNLFTDTHAKRDFTRFYEQLTGDHTPVGKQIIEKKSAILEDYMGGELNNLCELFLELGLAEEAELKSLPPGSLKAAIAAFLIDCPVYRYYGNNLPLQDINRDGLKALFKKIRSINDIEPAVDLLEKVILTETAEGTDETYTARAKDFYLRCMQFSGPLMAKGVEDTLMYTYNRFLGHNDVGDNPEAFGISKRDFHEKMLVKQNLWPLSLNGTATHDTKRGEDVRARLNVLSNLPEEWIKAVSEWRIMNAALPDMPDANDEYFVYQTLIGTYPMPGVREDDYLERFHAYLEKALREGKTNSSWADPDFNYEKNIKDFATALLEGDSLFLESFKAIQEKVADYGIINSLSQLLLKFTCPGVPDVYQGTELWDLSLVDPDNRRPVDYVLREKYLEQIQTEEPAIAQLWEERYSGKIKLWLLHKLLQHRQSAPELFNLGDYIPLSVKGRYAKHVFAFARRYGHEWYITAVPLDLAGLTKKLKANQIQADWKDTRIVLPAEAPANWKSVLNTGKGKAVDGFIAVAEIFSDFPLAFLKMELPLNDRGAGVLLHITSLPSVYGIGDFGKEAEKFIGFLSRARQKYWQILPLNPIGEEQAYSPYSSVSGLAGNILLISPDLLAEDGLLSAQLLRKYRLPSRTEVDFNKVTMLKKEVLDIAWQTFNSGKHYLLKKAFDQFCSSESGWLNDFALYIVLKEHHQSAPWYEWEKEFKSRNNEALQQFSVANEALLTKIKWQQFIFFKQWHELRAFAHQKGVKLYGDLPFYVGHDSADVWSNPEIFSIDAEGQLTGVAGVPPDYFNAEGQLWGMPVYNWATLKAGGYTWWLERIRKNMELYDLLRLDHFRAFYDYWEVPAGAENAINGEWHLGPGTDFFEVLQREFPEMPFIAEDLGKITAEVFLLRDAFALPGMKVLQFSFGEDIANSEHVPHGYATTNFVVYTGTHDNNTSLGWYEQDSTKGDRQRIEDYAGVTVSKKNVHVVMGRLAYMSIAKIVILPVQDILGLDERSRMNTPATVVGNWGWRLKAGQLGLMEELRLKMWTEIFGRV